jgi:hypothetical protein
MESYGNAFCDVDAEFEALKAALGGLAPSMEAAAPRTAGPLGVAGRRENPWTAGTKPRPLSAGASGVNGSSDGPSSTDSRADDSSDAIADTRILFRMCRTKRYPSSR